MNIFYKYASVKKGDVALMTEDDFNRMVNDGLFNRTKIRDIELADKYTKLRQNKIKKDDCIDLLRQEYPYLQFDTIRKIIYGIGRLG